MSKRLLLLALLASPCAVAQQFEVASVKEVHGAPPHAVSFNLNHEKLTLEAATLRQLAGYAYNVVSLV